MHPRSSPAGTCRLLSGSAALAPPSQPPCWFPKQQGACVCRPPLPMLYYAVLKTGAAPRPRTFGAPTIVGPSVFVTIETCTINRHNSTHTSIQPAWSRNPRPTENSEPACSAPALPSSQLQTRGRTNLTHHLHIIRPIYPQLEYLLTDQLIKHAFASCNLCARLTHPRQRPGYFFSVTRRNPVSENVDVHPESQEVDCRLSNANLCLYGSCINTGQ
jgi:hypothetical protein